MTSGHADLEPVEGRPKGRRVLEKTRVRVPLIRDLAAGENVTELAVRYDVTYPTIIAFRERHAAEIEQVRANLANELAAYWIVNRANRIGVYQDQVEAIEELDELDAAMLRVAQQALRNVAEETGQLVTRVDTSVLVRYELNGVPLDDLR